jgi:predicted alpha-1,2-mannosidase
LAACAPSPSAPESPSGDPAGGASAGATSQNPSGGSNGTTAVVAASGAGSPQSSNDAGLTPWQDAQGATDGPLEAQALWITAPATHVNTLLGTTNGGNVFPGADYPFGMIQWSPDTTPDRPSGGGYEYDDNQLIGFSLTHISGPGCSGAFGDVPILPWIGAAPGGDLNAVSQPFNHNGEIATAGYYSVQLGSPAITTELTATLHSAMARFTYPATRAAGLLFKLQDSAAGNFGNATASVVSNQEVSGSTSSGNFCGTGTPYVLHFDMVFDQPFSASDVVPQAGRSSPGFIFLTFDTSQNKVIQAKIGISFVSTANARANIEADNPTSQWAFDSVKDAAATAWNEALGKIQIAGGTSGDQELFYTSVYHALLHPNVASDVNGEYVGFDKNVHTVSPPQKDQYVNYSGWDIYHTQVQLSALIAPFAMSDSAQSMLNDAAQNGGSLPKWSLESGENGIMVGDPADGILAGYYAFGATQFDTASALKVMLNEATVPNDIRPGLSEYETIGYVPDDSDVDQSAGVSLEYCQADFALSQFAAALGDSTDAAAMLERSQNWQYLYEPSVGMFIPKLRSGAFVAGVGPTSSHGMTEGDASQYRWIIAYNRGSVLAAMGGPSVVNPALVTFFTKLDDYQGPSALMTNEFELGVPYWNDQTGAPWQAQDVANRIRTQLYHDAPRFIDGYGANDDLGAMSSALSWLMLGVYPDYPGSAVLSLNGPEFTDERIALPSGNFLTVHAEGASETTPYIQSLQVNGQPSDRAWLDSSVIQTGATLDFTMGATPNESWAAATVDVPPSYGVDSTSAFVFATANPLTLAPRASAVVTLTAVSTRSDVSQSVSWSVSPQSVSVSPARGAFMLAAGGEATSRVTVTAPAATGPYAVAFPLTSSVGATPPTFVLLVTVQ